MRIFKTPKGTELPLLDLRGKDYLQVAHRLVWFREQHPDWSISTEYVQLSENYAVARAVIADQTGRTISTAHKCEDRKGFQDFMEKAETGAIGRALAACGYGTQFAPELDEAERIVDSPLSSTKRVGNASLSPVKTQTKGIPTATRGTVSEAQLKRLYAIRKKSNWSEDDIKQQLAKIGLKDEKELNYVQYEHLCKVIETVPKESNKTVLHKAGAASTTQGDEYPF